jgi:hypothetical protein
MVFGDWAGPTPPAGARVKVVSPWRLLQPAGIQSQREQSEHSVTVLSSNNPMPLSVSFNDFSRPMTPYIEALEGSLITITNVHPSGSGTTPCSSGSNVAITNDAGDRLFSRGRRVGDIISKPMPAFAYEIDRRLARFRTTPQPL